MLWADTNRASGHLLGQHRRVGGGVDRVLRWPTTSVGTAIERRTRDDGAIRPKMIPCIVAAIAAGRWSNVSRTMPTQNGTSPRGIGRVSARSRPP